MPRWLKQSVQWYPSAVYGLGGRGATSEAERRKKEKPVSIHCAAQFAPAINILLRKNHLLFWDSLGILLMPYWSAVQQRACLHTLSLSSDFRADRLAQNKYCGFDSRKKMTKSNPIHLIKLSVLLLKKNRQARTQRSFRLNRFFIYPDCAEEKHNRDGSCVVSARARSLMCHTMLWMIVVET